MGDQGYSGVLDAPDAPPDGSTGFFSHFWNNLEILGAAAADVADHAVGGSSTLTADVAARQLAAGKGQSGPTDAQVQAARDFEQQVGIGAILKDAADKSASDAADKFSSLSRIVAVGAILIGGLYVLVLVKR